LKRIRILLAEDNQGDVFLVRDALEHHGIEFELEVVKNGELALAAVDRFGQSVSSAPDIFLLDLNLPRAAGDVVLQRFRESAGCSGIPVIIMTSSDAPQDRERVARLGISYYFRKPSDLDEFRRLGEVVKSLISRDRLCNDSEGAATAGT
jgi:two-component system, chemotaxis family, response regulator Rcp1